MTSMVAQVKSIKGDNFPNGKGVKDSGRKFYYPNGQIIKEIMAGPFYPNGQTIQSAGQFYYPNGKKLNALFGEFYDLDGKVVKAMPMIEWPPREATTPTPSVGPQSSSGGLAGKWDVTKEEIRDAFNDVAMPILRLHAPKAREINQEELKSKIKPKFYSDSMQRFGISERQAAQYFDEFWNSDYFQPLLTMFPKQ